MSEVQTLNSGKLYLPNRLVLDRLCKGLSNETNN